MNSVEEDDNWDWDAFQFAAIGVPDSLNSVRDEFQDSMFIPTDGSRSAQEITKSILLMCLVEKRLREWKPGTALDLSYLNLTELPELPSELLELECSGNRLVRLPTLPSSLCRLNCADNVITELVELPATLKNLNCSHNQLSCLPAVPTTVEFIECSWNKLQTIRVDSPSALQTLYCDNNQLTTLSLPETLDILCCSFNPGLRLETLPNSLRILSCMECSLASLPPLPRFLEVLLCSGNELVTLPPLPATLVTLECKINKLVTLPLLSPALEALVCGDNMLTSLPLRLPPTLLYLHCCNNRLSHLFSTFPEALTLLNCRNNRLREIPDNTSAPNLYMIVCDANPLVFLPDPGIAHVGFFQADCIEGFPGYRDRIVGETGYLAYYQRVLEWQRETSRRRIQERTRAVKEELMMNRWSPTRVDAWMDAGGEVEDM